MQNQPEKYTWVAISISNESTWEVITTSHSRGGVVPSSGAYTHKHTQRETQMHTILLHYGFGSDRHERNSLLLTMN